jgi:hypothetical protein
MDGSLAWRARYDDLEERVRSAGTLLADRTMPEPERDEVSDEFIRAWQQFCETIQQHPESQIEK